MVVSEKCTVWMGARYRTSPNGCAASVVAERRSIGWRRGIGAALVSLVAAAVLVAQFSTADASAKRAGDPGRPDRAGAGSPTKRDARADSGERGSARSRPDRASDRGGAERRRTEPGAKTDVDTRAGVDESDTTSGADAPRRAGRRRGADVPAPVTAPPTPAPAGVESPPARSRPIGAGPVDRRGGATRPAGGRRAGRTGTAATAGAVAPRPVDPRVASASTSASGAGGKAGRRAPSGVGGSAVAVDPLGLVGPPLMVLRTVTDLPAVYLVGIALMLALCLALALLSARERRRSVRLEREMLRDVLTGAANRTAFERALIVEWRRAERYGRPLGVMFIDLDGFKAYNDTYGHLAGDRLLREVAALITDRVRGCDLVARFGGDEFVVVCPETDLAGMARLADRIRAGTVHLTVGLSIGVAERSGESDDIRAMVARADAQMYTAKSGAARLAS